MATTGSSSSSGGQLLKQHQSASSKSELILERERDREREQHQQPPAKRPKMALNFSIESIMRSAPCESPASQVSPPIMSHSKRGSSSGHNHHHHHHPTAAATINNNTNTTTEQAGTSQAAGDSRLSQVECQLDNKDMWDKFHSLNTEMIITKTGRRMFPVVKVQFQNLDPNARYAVSMDIVPVDNKRYRYAYHKSCWQVAGKADPSAEARLYPHPDSPFNGDLLSRQVISFEKVKLTNNEMDKSGHIILNSMHKYQPRVHLIELKAPTNTHTTQQPQLNVKDYRTFLFPETVFTAVTAYQNQLITKMKIDKNPFAKGFRDSSRLSDLDRNDYMGSLDSAGPHMDAYQLLASAANNPWYSAAAAAAVNPFSPMGPCSTAQAAQLQAAQLQASQLQATQLQATQAMWLAAFSACLNGATAPGALGSGPPRMSGPSPHLPTEQALAESGPDSSSSSATGTD